MAASAETPRGGTGNEGKESGTNFEAKRNVGGCWGVSARGRGMSAVEQISPMQIELWDTQLGIPRSMQGGYASLREKDGVWTGTGDLRTAGGTVFEFRDEWSAKDGTLLLRRTVKVRGAAVGGFRSIASLCVIAPLMWPDVEWFMPGFVYGNFDQLRDLSIGGRRYYQPGAFSVWIREDRMPAPMIGMRFSDGSTLTVANPSPNGETTAEEGASFSHEAMTDARFQFGSIGAEERGRTLTLGYTFPGTEGELSYGKKTAKGPETAHEWRRRYHPIQDGFTQRYEVAFLFDSSENLNAFVARAWRWAWRQLDPQVNPQDLDAVRRSMVDILKESTIETEKWAGVQIVRPAVPGLKESADPRSIMGFVGYALGSAEAMLIEASYDGSERGRELRRLAEKSIASFLRIPMNPPKGEGFYLKTGELAVSQSGAATGEKEIFLRCFCDDMKSLMRAYENEKRLGREHPEWLAWVRQFGDWLLTQEQPGGGFPRSWKNTTGELFSNSTTGTFNAVPLYARMYRLTGHKAYLTAAERSGEFCWKTGHARGRFVGGTIDNPDVIDKEAATISLEGYLELYGVTSDKRWLECAKVAADHAETWMYVWNVPMPADADDAKLQWKRGVPTTGVQLIATGHSLVDAYMAFDVASYARLYRLTNDSHYLDVARILLHNTKAMVGIPGRTHGLRGAGWQQEHYCFTLPRGVGRHQYWLPWVSVSQLRGINDLIAMDRKLYDALATARSTIKARTGAGK